MHSISFRTETKMLCFLLAACICLTGCVPAEPHAAVAPSSAGQAGHHGCRRPEEAAFQADFGFTLEEYNARFEVPKEREKCIQYAGGIMQGELYVHEAFPEPMPYRLETLDWGVQFSDSPSTWQLYLQSMGPLAILCQAYVYEGDPTYLEYGVAFLGSWLAYESNPLAASNPFVWYDHGSALRANVLIWFTLLLKDAELLTEDLHEELYTLMIRHGKFLADDTNYTKNHNHGIFQDYALLCLGYFLHAPASAEWKGIAKERLQAQKSFAFNEEMVHVENSPGYQIGVMRLFLDAGEFMITMGDADGEQLLHDIFRSATFLQWAYKPNGLVAEIGDTNSMLYEGKRYFDQNYSEYNNEHFTYAASLGTLGTKPQEHSAYFPYSGYYFYRSTWEKEDFTNATWKMFKAGYTSKTHKHADDLSIMFYARGYDIFVDPGWYNYVTGNRYRDYFVSSAAHNTVIVDGKSYSPTVENSTKTGMLLREETGGAEHLLAFNDMYDGVQIDRHFYSMGDLTLLYDNIVSSDTHTYSQLFHLSEDMTVLEAEDDEVLIQIADTEYFVRIRQLASGTKLSVIHGDFDKEEYGYISRQMNHLTSIDTLKFDIQGKNADFVTAITIEDANGRVLLSPEGESCIQDSITYEPAHSRLTYAYGGEQIVLTLTPRERISAGNIKLSIVRDQLSLTNLQAGEGLQYAWYLIDRESAKVFYKSSWSEENTLECRFTGEEPQEILVKAYVRSPLGERKSSVAAALRYDTVSGSYEDVTAASPYLDLHYQGHSMAHQGGNRYVFKVNYDYSWNAVLRWYVYRNGGYYTTFSTTDPEMEFTFSEPGGYTVMYYLTTANGDNEFWNFPQVEIG